MEPGKKENLDPAFNNANGRMYNFRCRAKLDNYNDMQRVRNQVMSATPINYTTECARLVSDHSCT